MVRPISLPPSTGPSSPTEQFGQINDWLAALRNAWEGTQPPQVTTNGQLWLDTSQADNHRLRARVNGEWRSIVSSFGLSVADLDTQLDDGPFVIPQTAANSPFPGRRGAGFTYGRGGLVTQTAFNQNPDERSLFFLRCSLAVDGSSWAPWERVFTQPDIVGAVSMASGVPSGAIIQKGGDNTAGQFVRWADGTQICTHRIQLVRQSPALLTRTWVFEAPFGNAQYRLSYMLRTFSGAPTIGMLGQAFPSDIPTLISVPIAMTLIAGQPTPFGTGDFALLDVTAIGEWA